MLESLADLDKAIFLFFNVQIANPVTDLVMPFVTSDTVLRLSFAIALGLLIWKGDARTRWLVLFSILTVAISDQLSSHLLKPIFVRPRPCHTLPIDTIRLLVPCGSGHSMPSSHAANAFGQAVLFGLVFRHAWRWLIGVAVLIALSRVFVGVHYPGDILVGAVVGVASGILVYFGYNRAMILIQKKRPPTGAGGFKQL